MTGDDYVEFCDQAHSLRQQIGSFFATFTDDRVEALNAFVRHEIVSTAAGKVEPVYDCLAALLAEEVEHRNDPHKNVTKLPRRFPDGCPF